MKIDQFTEGQIELLQSLCQGCNIALYRNGQIRLRDSKHNPLKNVRGDMFEKVREYCEQRDGLFYINPIFLKQFPYQITQGIKT